MRTSDICRTGKPEDVEKRRQQNKDDERDQGEANEFKPSIVEPERGYGGHLSLPSDLEGKESLRSQHQDANNNEQREHFRHRSGEKELQRQLRLRDGEGGGDGP